MKQTTQMNPMRMIKVEKVTLNIGSGRDQKTLEKGMKLIKHIAGKDSVKTLTEKRIQGWGLRPGLPVGAKLTVRGKEAEALLPRLIYAKDNILKESNFDDYGNISFGIPEYVDIKDIKYDTEIGMMGLQASVTLARPGFRVKTRRKQSSKIGKSHIITKEEAMKFMKEKYAVKVGEEQ